MSTEFSDKILLESVPRDRKDRIALIDMFARVSPPERAGKAILPKSLEPGMRDRCMRLYREILRQAQNGQVMQGGTIRVRISIRGIARMGLFHRNCGNRYLCALEKFGFLRHRKTLHGSYVYLHWSRVLMSRRRRNGAVKPPRLFCTHGALAPRSPRFCHPPFRNPPFSALKAVNHWYIRSTKYRGVRGEQRINALNASMNTLTRQNIPHPEAQLSLEMGPRPLNEVVPKALPQPHCATQQQAAEQAGKNTSYAVDESLLLGRERNFFSYLRECFGDSWDRINSESGSWWLKLYRENPDNAYEIASETKTAMSENRIRTTILRYAADLANRMRAWRYGEDNPMNCVEPSTETAARIASERAGLARDRSDRGTATDGCDQDVQEAFKRARQVADDSLKRAEQQLAADLNEVMSTADDDLKEMLTRLLRLAKKE